MPAGIVARNGCHEKLTTVFLHELVQSLINNCPLEEVTVTLLLFCCGTDLMMGKSTHIQKNFNAI